MLVFKSNYYISTQFSFSKLGHNSESSFSRTIRDRLQTRHKTSNRTTFQTYSEVAVAAQMPQSLYTFLILCSVRSRFTIIRIRIKHFWLLVDSGWHTYESAQIGFARRVVVYIQHLTERGQGLDAQSIWIPILPRWAPRVRRSVLIMAQDSGINYRYIMTHPWPEPNRKPYGSALSVRIDHASGGQTFFAEGRKRKKNFFLER